GLVVAWGDLWNVRAYHVPQISVNIGALEREAGDLEAAVGHLRDGVSGDPRDAIGWVHLALALEQLDRRQAALDAYLDAIAIQPEHQTLLEMAQRFCRRHDLDPQLPATYARTSDATARAELRASARRRLGDDHDAS